MAYKQPTTNGHTHLHCALFVDLLSTHRAGCFCFAVTRVVGGLLQVGLPLTSTALEYVFGYEFVPLDFRDQSV